MSARTPTTAAAVALLDGFSLEITGRDVAALTAARADLPDGTRVNVTYLGTEDPESRIGAAAAVARLGLDPVPHISARRIASEEVLTTALDALREAGAADRVFVVGGDPAVPEGPFADALAVIESGLLQAAGVREVGITGYPEGHPGIDGPALWAALRTKTLALADAGLGGEIITQFGFDPAPVLRWVEQVRGRGIDAPIRIGVPGPAGVRRLLAFAGRFGIASSAGIARKYGFSLTNLLGTAGPGPFLEDLAAAYDPGRHGELRVHFYTFGGVEATAEWVREFTREAVR